MGLTQLGDLSVEGAAHRSPVEGQPGQTVMTHSVTAEKKTRNLIALKGEDVLTHTTLQHLEMNTHFSSMNLHTKTLKKDIFSS